MHQNAVRVPSFSSMQEDMALSISMKLLVKQNFKANLITAPQAQTPLSIERKISSRRFNPIATSGLSMKNDPNKLSM